MKKKTLYWKFIAILPIFLLFNLTVFGQNLSVSGVVTDAETGEALIGVSVSEKGTANGVITDIDGRYSINVPKGADLVFQYLGYSTLEHLVNGSVLNVKLSISQQLLDEVVVVGYGVQKKSVVTASIAKVSSDDLANTAPVRMDNALKGLAAGVSVTSSSGQPGAASKVRIRGIGTINNSDPLYIVDGMPIDGGLDYLNPGDIASIEVLKDAASGAVYGARAANGVVLVTTKVGTLGRTRVSYDFSYGWQRPWKERDVLNASQYAMMMNEGSVNSGGAIKYNDPYSYGKGTNWQKETFNNDAPVMNHQLSISGASESLNYLISMGYYTQEGIIGGNYDRSNYDRLTLRSNTLYTIFDESKKRNWLKSLKITSNVSYARIKSKDIEANSSYGSPLGSALSLSPILGVYVEGQAAQDQLDANSGNSDFTPMYDPRNGKLYMLAGADYNEMVNPLAALSLPGRDNWSHKFVANFALDFNIWDNLKFRSSYGVDLAFWGNDGYTKKFYLNANNQQTKTNAFSERQNGTTWQVENVLTYDKLIDKHTFSVLLGQSAKKNRGSLLGGSRFGIINLDRPYINASNGLRDDGAMNAWGAPHDQAALASLFARVSYNFDERYMFQGTIRRDGSSRFGSNNHYATFPSFSTGWNLTNEEFMKDRPEWLTSTKARVSWGKNGNENIGNYRYTVLTQGGQNYIFGSGENIVNGVKAGGLANPDLKWEESEQWNYGLDFGFFKNALTFSVDYYKKTTNGMLMEMNIPSYVGESKPLGNVGKMENSGVELEAAYRFQVANDWNFRIGANASYLKNKLIEYGNDSGWANLDSFQGTGAISRAQNGKPFPYFYGYKTAGIFQNIDEVNAYKNAQGELLQPNAVPGDVRYVDINGDGKISDDDRTDIGKGMPDWTFGFNFSVSWKDFDMNMMWQGTIGNDIYDATRRTDITSSNLPSWMLDRWTGEGTSNKYPRFAYGDNTNWQSSDLYVYDGSYLRLKNIQIGYTLPRKLTSKAFVSSLRIYVAAENLLTFTKYHGFDPEISSGGTSLGIDRGVYPQSRVLSVGANLKF